MLVINVVDYSVFRRKLERVPLTLSKKYCDRNQWKKRKTEENKLVRTQFEPKYLYVMHILLHSTVFELFLFLAF